MIFFFSPSIFTWYLLLCLFVFECGLARQRESDEPFPSSIQRDGCVCVCLCFLSVMSEEPLVLHAPIGMVFYVHWSGINVEKDYKLK